MSIKSKELFHRIRRIEINSMRLVEDLLRGMYHSVFKGNGMEFEEVRAYQTGDDVRSIDWNVTARMGYPFVKTFREERELTVVILVDVSASSRFGTTQHTKKDLIAEVAAVLAFSAIKNNDKVGLVLFSDRIEKYIPPSKGTRHVLRVIRELLAFEPQGKGTDLAQALSFLGRVQRRTAVCFLLSDFLSTKDYMHELNLIARRHDLIAMNVSDPKECALPDLGIVTVTDFETGEEIIIDTSNPSVIEEYSQRAQERKDETKKEIERVKAGYVDLSTDQPYLAAIRKYFALRELRR